MIQIKKVTLRIKLRVMSGGSAIRTSRFQYRGTKVRV